MDRLTNRETSGGSRLRKVNIDGRRDIRKVRPAVFVSCGQNDPTRLATVGNHQRFRVPMIGKLTQATPASAYRSHGGRQSGVRRTVQASHLAGPIMSARRKMACIPSSRGGQKSSQIAFSLSYLFYVYCLVQQRHNRCSIYYKIPIQRLIEAPPGPFRKTAPHGLRSGGVTSVPGCPIYFLPLAPFPRAILEVTYCPVHFKHD